MSSSKSEPDEAEHKLTLQVKKLLWEKGQKALQLAKQSVVEDKIPSERLQAAVEYFMSSWEDVVHPALMALACEAVGGNADSTTEVGVAYVLLAGGADVHDDIIDESTFKYSKETVLGKFGKDIAILTGDALLFKGFFVLHKACEALEFEQQKEIIELTKRAFYGISSAEAKASCLREKSHSPNPDEYFEMIKTKATVGEAVTKIGAFIGKGSPEQIAMVGDFGRTLSILFTIRDEYIDVFDVDELKNRNANECLPLPILFALESKEKRDEIIRLLGKNTLNKNEHAQIIDVVLEANQTRKLRKKMTTMIKEETERLGTVPFHQNPLVLLLKSTIEDL
jgi:geranylgeranyl pyrophosphate synthase